MKMKLSFAPGCFDDFEGTQEELDAVIKEIEEMIEDGTIFRKATLLSTEEANDLVCETLAKKIRQ